MFLQKLKDIVLPNYLLVLSVLKLREIGVFWNKKKSSLNRCSLLNSSIGLREKPKTWVFLLLLFFKNKIIESWR